MKTTATIYKNSSVSFFKQITKDYMLFAALFAPLLAGLLIHFGMPFAEGVLTKQLHKKAVLSPYYKMADLLLCMVTPLMAGFISAMLMLGEKDDRIISYLSVTPLGKKGYLISRLLIPSAFSTIIGFIICILFKISILTVPQLVIITVFTAVLGMIICLFIVSMSSNKVEGMVMGKLSGILLLGIFIPFFFHTDIQYLGCILPSFFLGKYAISGQGKWLICGCIMAVIWLFFLYRRFLKRSFY